MEPTQQTPVQSGQTTPVSAPIESKSSKRLPIIVIVIVVLILLGVGGYFYMNNQKQAAQKATEIKQSSQEFTNLENDLSNESEGSDTADFQTLDQDLQTL